MSEIWLEEKLGARVFERAQARFWADYVDKKVPFCASMLIDYFIVIPLPLILSFAFSIE